MKKLRLKKKWKIIFSAAFGVIVLLSVILFFVLSGNKYSEYKEYNEDNKKYGTVERYEKDNDNFYMSIHYPKVKEEKLNSLIEKSYKAYIKGQKKKDNQKDILYADYSSDKIYNQYIVLKTQYKRIDAETKKETIKKELLTYNTKTKDVVKLKDCLRGKYIDLLKQKGVNEVNSDTSLIEVKKNEFVLYTDNELKNKVSINYKNNKEYIKLANKNIPSNAPLNVKNPKKMKIDKKKKMVAITLDDGPHKTLTAKAMKAFEKYNGRGTFFQLGRNMEYYPNIVKDVFERGHEVASHTYQHAQLTKLDALSLDQEIKKVQDICFKITGTDPTLVRPPYGARNDNVKAAFASYGLDMILWDGDTEDWRYSKKVDGAQTVCNNIIGDAKAGKGDGNIVLIHDIHENSVTGLEMALKQLSKEGYQFVTVSDLKTYKGHRDYK